MAIRIVFRVEFIQFLLAFGAVLDELDQAVLLVILRVDLRVDGSHTLSGGDHGVLVHGHVRVGLSARLRTGYLCLDLLGDGLKAVCVRRSQMVFNFDGFPRVNELVQPNLVLFGE